ncbi:choice-of-anchor D domain-containing protein [Curtobacterium pusillum]|uniref:choice-of-anchor D domain-containing protein n=1 Tax=Curtobacterium pusillum TaxID=69373 RepID=UPI0011A85A6B|nr:choice-of-anchor D domain-containing protein [Curtobacterium pusillum]
MQRFTRAAPMAAAALLTAGAVGFTGLGTASAATAAPPTGGVLQILSPHYSNRGTPQFADGANVQRYLADTTRGIDARMTVTATTGASFILTPPDGKPLTTGVYRLVGTQSYGANVPTLTINGEYISGEFDILDLASNPTNGAITRFDGIVPGVGEYRFGEDAAGSVVFGARNLVFTKTFIGLPKTAQVETVHNTGTSAVTLGTPTVAGVNASSFSVSGSTCKTTLAAGATCTFTVGFAPKTAGPATAALSVKVGTATRTVPLTGSSFLGTTGITSSGKGIVDQGKTTKVTAANTAMTVVSIGSGWMFNADRLDGSGSALNIRLTSPNDQPIPVGTTKTTVSGRYSMVDTVNSSGCDSNGTITVKQFINDPVSGLPDTVDMSFVQYCDNGEKLPQTGTLQWQARADVAAPAAPTAVAVSATSPRKVTWKPSASKDAKSVVARLVQGSGANATPQSGTPLTVSGTSAAVPSVPAGQQYTVALFAVDATGNVSKAAVARFGTAPVTVTAPGRPTITSTSSGTGTVTVSFTPPASDGGLPITSYVLSTLYGSQQVSGTSSPLTLTGLPADGNMVEITAVNAAGKGTPSYAVPVTIG